MDRAGQAHAPPEAAQARRSLWRHELYSAPRHVSVAAPCAFGQPAQAPRVLVSFVHRAKRHAGGPYRADTSQTRLLSRSCTAQQVLYGWGWQLCVRRARMCPGHVCVCGHAGSMSPALHERTTLPHPCNTLILVARTPALGRRRKATIAGAHCGTSRVPIRAVCVVINSSETRHTSTHTALRAAQRRGEATVHATARLPHTLLRSGPSSAR